MSIEADLAKIDLEAAQEKRDWVYGLWQRCYDLRQQNAVAGEEYELAQHNLRQAELDVKRCHVKLAHFSEKEKPVEKATTIISILQEVLTLFAGNIPVILGAVTALETGGLAGLIAYVEALLNPTPAPAPAQKLADLIAKAKAA